MLFDFVFIAGLIGCWATVFRSGAKPAGMDSEHSRPNATHRRKAGHRDSNDEREAVDGFFDSDVHPSRPNILFIVVDDLGSNDLGMKGTGIQTPTIDAFAKQGVYLSKYYVLPSCSPTRAAFMSGRYPLHTGINSAIPHHATYGLPVDEETLPDMMRRAGYKTHAVGKWHIGHAAWEYTPTFRGFDSFFGFYNGGEDHFTHQLERSYGLRRDRSPRCGPGCSEVVDERGNYSTHVFTREAIRIVREHDPSSGPLFLYMAYQAVHFPSQAPEEYVARYRHRGWDRLRETYAGMLTSVDEGIGNLTAAMQVKDVTRDLVIVFTTDNGGPTESCAVQGSSNSPRRGGKCTIWEGGVTGDAFIWGPPFLPMTSYHLFHAVDWLPTLAELLGVRPSGKPLDGVSQLRSLTGGAPSRSEIYYGVSDQQVGNFGPAIRVGRWKLVEGRCGPAKSSGWDPSWSSAARNKPTELYEMDVGHDAGSAVKYQLFDLEDDPEERSNVASKFPHWVEELKQRIEWYKAGAVPQAQSDDSCTAVGQFMQHPVVGQTWQPWCWQAEPPPAPPSVLRKIIDSLYLR